MDLGTAQKKEQVSVDNRGLVYTGKIVGSANLSVQLKWITSNTLKYDKYSVNTQEYARYLATGAGSELVPGT
ncbi:MAG: hypothetical protein R3F37_03615 [Candidatus Competibacteraceae bacterium]